MALSPTTTALRYGINIPTLTEERRRELVKLVHRKVEDAHVAARNIRRDCLESLRSMEKDKALSKDGSRQAQEQLQQVTDSYIGQMDVLLQNKEAEIMEV